MKPLYRFLFALLLCSGPIHAQIPGNAIRLKTGAINPSDGLLHRKLTSTAWKQTSFADRHYVLLQFDQLPTTETSRAMAANGIRLSGFVTGKTFLAEISEPVTPQAFSPFSVRDVFALPASLKLSPKITPASVEHPLPEELLAVGYFGTLDTNQIKSALQQAGAKLVLTKIQPHRVYLIQARYTALQKIAALPFVSFIQPLRLKDIPLNNNNRAIHGVDALAAAPLRNLRGQNIVLGIGDDADPSSHIDFAGRLIMRTSQPVNFHGTHTSGTLVGGGILNPRYQGMAPNARLVVNAFSNIIADGPLYVQDFNMVASNNSYYDGADNCPGEGEYDVLSNYLDYQSEFFPTLLTVFAVGNDGALTCSPYPASYATVKSGYQCSKNALTVGAFNTSSYTITPFSSRGPVFDGRIKPEVVCGGQGIVSTAPYNSYGSDNGTSMAAPTCTGIMGLLYERYRQLNGGATPSAALIKAVACNTADDNGNPGPDFLYGFGLLNGRAAVECLENNQYKIGAGIADGNTDNITLPAIPAGVQQVKILLYWPDVAAIPNANNSLVNDLDLTVTDGSGTVHHPLILDPSVAGVNTVAVEGIDHTNNIEQVVITNPSAGALSVQVKGFSVPAGPQPYVVAYEIINPSVTLEYPFGTESLVSGETETIRWTAYGADTNPFTIEYSADGGASWSVLTNNAPAASRGFVWTVPNLPTNQALVRVTRNGTGYVGTSHFNFTVSAQPTLTISNPCRGYAQLNWNSIPGATAYEVMQFKTDSMQVIASLTDTSYLVAGLNKDSSYWFSVRPVIAGSPGRRSLAVNTLPANGACTALNLANDLSLEQLLSPVSARQFTSNPPGVKQISMQVRNPGPAATSTPINYSYQVNGGPVVTELYAGVLPPNFAGVYTFSPGNSYDFSNPGTYQVKVWVHYAADTFPKNDTISVQIKSLRNDPVLLSPNFVEGFESAALQTDTTFRLGLDSLDRADFSPTSHRGRLSTFFDSGFPRSGNRCITLDVINEAASVTDSLITTYNLSAYAATDQIWLDLYYLKSMSFTGNAGSQIWIRGNDLSPWIAVKNLGDFTDAVGQYNHVNVDVTGVLSKAVPAQAVSSSFQVKCGWQGFTPALAPSFGGGLSFDDITLSKSQNDAGLISLDQPFLGNSCNFSNVEPVVIKIKNYSTDTLFNVAVSYASNSDTVTEIIPYLPPQDTVLYEFHQLADLSAYGTHYFRSWVSATADNYLNNDSSARLIFQTTPLITAYPYLEGFEANNGYWFTNGTNDDWQWGKPSKTVINRAANGKNAWVTNLTGNYNDNEYAFLYSPCFDLSSLSKPVFSFSHIFQTEDDCSCDFHWVEYSLNDSTWNVLGNASSGVNWYDNGSVKAWQQSNPRWHVSSFDIPTTATKVRFRISMYSDPGTNYEGVGVDDIHIFDKAPVFADSSLTAGITQSISGTGWNDVEQAGKRVVSINPNGQDLGPTLVKLFIDPAAIRDTAGQDYGARNLVIRPSNPPAQPVTVRFYFTDSESNRLIFDTACAGCTRPRDAYLSGITQYSGTVSDEDSSLNNNLTGKYLYHLPQTDVQIIPYDNGYYAEYKVTGFSEFWINGGGKSADHPLAAWLQDFTAVKQQNTGLLNWSSWQEQNPVKYIIERSTDSLQFTAIGSVPARAHQDSTASYTFTDPSLATGSNYYRLVLVYSNGDSSLSPVRKLTGDAAAPVFAVYPNPTQDYITVTTSTQSHYMQLFDITGRLVFNRATNGYLQVIPMRQLARGMYLLKVETGTGTQLVKVERR